jgi:deoxycytidylate deaminase
VDAGIKEVVYVEAYPIKEAAAFLALNKVDVRPFSGFKARAFNRVFKPAS